MAKLRDTTALGDRSERYGMDEDIAVHTTRASALTLTKPIDYAQVSERSKICLDGRRAFAERDEA
jgi:hypothetical protein